MSEKSGITVVYRPGNDGHSYWFVFADDRVVAAFDNSDEAWAFVNKNNPSQSSEGR